VLLALGFGTSFQGVLTVRQNGFEVWPDTVAVMQVSFWVPLKCDPVGVTVVCVPEVVERLIRVAPEVTDHEADAPFADSVTETG
jgi:hypothetical protein